MASLDDLFAKDNLFWWFQKVRVEPNFPLKGPVTHFFFFFFFLITAKIIDCTWGFLNLRNRDVSPGRNLDYNEDYWASRSYG